MKACQASGFEPQIRASSDDLGVVVSLVERGLGVAAVPALALYDRSIHATLRGTDPPLTRRVSACVRRDERNHPAVSLMLDELAAFGQSYTSPNSTQDSTRCVRWKACWTHPLPAYSWRSALPADQTGEAAIGQLVTLVEWPVMVIRDMLGGPRTSPTTPLATSGRNG